MLPFCEEKCKVITNAEYDLFKAGLDWKTGNYGVHLQVMHGNKKVADLWPTTGRWALHNRKKYSFGVHNLIAAIKRVN